MTRRQMELEELAYRLALDEANAEEQADMLMLEPMDTQERVMVLEALIEDTEVCFT